MTEQTVQAIRPLNRFPQAPMSEDLSNIFLGLSLMSADNVKGMWEEISQKERLVMIIDHRSKLVGLNLSAQLKVFLAFVAKNPANAMLYIHAIWHDESGRVRADAGEYGMIEFAHLFPEGYPEEYAIEHAWRMQKNNVPGSLRDNCIDDDACFEAIYDESQWVPPASFDRGPLGEVFRMAGGIAKALADHE